MMKLLSHLLVNSTKQQPRAQVLAAYYKSAPLEMWGKDFGQLATLLAQSSNSERSGLRLDA
jgi:hypothetical protein